MEILHTDFKKGIVKLKITDYDDLWYLSHLIDAGDFIAGKTTRKIKIGDDENAKTVKKVFTLKIEAETISFSEHSLRINGKVKEGPEEVPRDSYHAISLELDMEFLLEKSQWLTFQKQKLQEAAQKKYSYLICILDREEAFFALTKKRGYEILVQLHGDVPKKSRKIEVKVDFQQELIKILNQYNERFNPEKIIIASPAFYKEDLLKNITTEILKKKIILAACSDVSERALDEVLKQPELAAVLKESKAREEQMLIDLLLQQIQNEGLAVYGWEDVQKAATAGAIKILLVTDELIRKKRQENNFTVLDEMMKHVDALQGEIHILTFELESGRRLQGLGGIAALLRYKLQW